MWIQLLPKYSNLQKCSSLSTVTALGWEKWCQFLNGMSTPTSLSSCEEISIIHNNFLFLTWLYRWLASLISSQLHLSFGILFVNNTSKRFRNISQAIQDHFTLPMYVQALADFLNTFFGRKGGFLKGLV